MKRQMAIFLSLCAVLVFAYLTARQWAIRHETLTFYDAARSRPVEVDIAVRRDSEMKANAGFIELPVAILSQGNTVKFTEYSFLANIFAAHGYLAVSIQHDLATDGRLLTKVGELYVGRLSVYERGITNIMFAVNQLKEIQPNANYDRLTMVGHSSGGDIALYFAKIYPDHVKRVVTLDSLRVPLLTDGKFKILSFRSKDPNFKPDPGVIPDDELCKKAGITVVNTSHSHNDMSDRGPDYVKADIRGTLDQFLSDDSSPALANTRRLRIPKPGPVSESAPALK